MRNPGAAFAVLLVACTLAGCAGVAAGPAGGYRSAGSLSDGWSLDARSAQPGYLYSTTFRGSNSAA